MNNNIKTNRKQCIKCEQKLPLTKDYFRVAKRNKDGFVGTCKACAGFRYTNVKKGHKTCSKCLIDKPSTLEYFGRLKDGLQSWCKECKRKDHLANREERNKRSKERYYELNPKEITPIGFKKCSNCKDLKHATNEFFSFNKNTKDGFSHRCKECRRKAEYWINPDKIKAKRKQYYSENKKEVLAMTKRYKEENYDWYRDYNRKYYLENQEEIKRNVKNYHYTRMKNDVGYRLLQRCRTRVYQALKAQNTHKSKRTIELIGCTVPELIDHLESQFTEGMTWVNYGEWHVDHIKPCALFDFTDEDQQKECFHYSNLQPLWAKDNLIKSDKYVQTL